MYIYTYIYIYIYIQIFKFKNVIINCYNIKEKKNWEFSIKKHTQQRPTPTTKNKDFPNMHWFPPLIINASKATTILLHPSFHYYFHSSNLRYTL